MCKEAQLNFNEPLTADLFGKVQVYLADKGYQLVIVSAADTSNWLYIGPTYAENGQENKQIFLEYTELNGGHYNFIKEMNQYLETAHFCRFCLKGYHFIGHKCEGACLSCHAPFPCSKTKLIDCDICGLTLNNEVCFTNHLRNTCYYKKKCEKCEVIYNSKRAKNHKCFEYLCTHCGKSYTNNPHYCLMQKLDIDKLIDQDSRNKIIVTFDIEAVQVLDEESGKSYHHPNLLISGKS